MLQIFKALADETRIRILGVLAQGAFNVNEIIEIFGMGQSRISRHLKILADCGLVTSRREGNWIYYALRRADEEPDISAALDLALRSAAKFPSYRTDLQRIESVMQRRRALSKKYFNRVGPDWEELQQEVLDGTDYRERSLEMLPADLETVVDLGVGAGLMLPALLGKSRRIIAVDSSQNMLQMAREFVDKEEADSAERCDFRLGELEHLPILDRTVDAAVALMVLHHIATPAAAIAEVYRVLKPGGIFVIADLMQHSVEAMREKYADLWLGFSPIEMMLWLKNAGFADVTSEVLHKGDKIKVILFKAVRAEVDPAVEMPISTQSSNT